MVFLRCVKSTSKNLFLEIMELNKDFWNTLKENYKLHTLVLDLIEWR